MPLYEFECPTHGKFDEFHSMSSVPRGTKCPECGAQSPKQFFCGQTVIPPKDNGWESLNGGKGQKIRQLAKHPHDPNQFCRSRNEMLEKVKRNEQKFSNE